ncbi:hypothetical protein, partial [Dialister succinatiphilus]|uniref:hypothetical protein n=1 Tax=Dialister succinatiphilus TaxID=487173 RepID=UPI0040287BE0
NGPQNDFFIFYHKFLDFIIFHQAAALHVSASRAVPCIDGSLRLVTAAIKIFNYKFPISVFGCHGIHRLSEKSKNKQ